MAYSLSPINISWVYLIYAWLAHHDKFIGHCVYTLPCPDAPVSHRLPEVKLEQNTFSKALLNIAIATSLHVLLPGEILCTLLIAGNNTLLHSLQVVNVPPPLPSSRSLSLSQIYRRVMWIWGWRLWALPGLVTRSTRRTRPVLWWPTSTSSLRNIWQRSWRSREILSTSTTHVSTYVSTSLLPLDTRK